MKRIKVLLMCVILGVMLCGCGAEEPVVSEQEETLKQELQEEAPEEVQEEVSVKEPEEDVVEEPVAEEEIPGQSEVPEEESKPSPAVFEEISAELTTYPVLKYTIAGEQKQLDYTMYESMYPYDMVSNPEFAIGYSTGDVTGDGLDELIVSIYVVGNTLSELMQDTYVYTIDADINDLNEILYVSSMGGEQYAPGYKYNVGAFATGYGTLNLDLWSEPAAPGEMPMMVSVELIYQDGMWAVNSSVAP